MSSNVIYRSNANLDNIANTEAAFKSLQPKYMALKVAELVAVNADVTTVVNAATRAATVVAPMEPEIRRLPDYEGNEGQQLQESADALDFAEAEYRVALKTADELSDTAQEIGETRGRFVEDLRNAANHKLIDPGYLNGYTGENGHNNLISDVRLLCRVYRKNWEPLSGKTCRTLEELDRAEKVLHRMEHLISTKGLDSTTVTQAADMRTRAFTLVVQRHDKVRRAVGFIRWEQGDADELVPSLYANRGGKKKQSEKEEPQQPGAQPQQPQQPTMGPNGPFVTTPATPAAPTGPTTPQRLPGMPGGSPFIQ